MGIAGKTPRNPSNDLFLWKLHGFQIFREMSAGSPEAMSGRKTARQPFWLSKAALALFFLIFVACAASLIALDRVVTSRNGLPLSVSSSPYSWTYGPTAILIVVLSLWRRVDYYYKLREPWRELLAGPSPANKSLLLDYITPFQVVSIIQALRRRHYAVAASIAAFFLLKLIILISTTLFVVRETNSDAVLNVTMQDAFDAAKVWPKYEAFSVRESEPASSVFGGGSASSIWTYLGKLSNVTTDETDWRLPDDTVTQRFAFSTGRTNVTKLEYPVDIFVPKISCEDATLSAPDNIKYDDYIQGRNYTFTSKTCANGGIMVDPCLGARYADAPLPQDTFTPCQPHPRVYSSYRVNCSHGLERTYYDPFASDFKATIKYYDDSSLTNNITSMKLVRSSALVCKIGYGIATANATLDLLTGDVSIPKAALDGKLRTLNNLSIAGFCLLGVLCLLLFFTSRQFTWIPPMSGSLAGNAAILANSPNLQAVLANSGHLVVKELRKRLTVQFQATTGPAGKFEVQADTSFGPLRQAPSIKSQGKKHAWVPLAVRLPVIAATFTAPLIAIGVLELLYHVLRDESHFVQVGRDSAALSYIIRIASTLVVFGIATMINNLDSTIVIFAPYSNLRPGSATADRSILFHLLSVNPFLVMFRSLQRRQFGPAASNGATLIAGFLTIIVSGLWLPIDSLVTDQPLTASVNNWDRTWFSDAADDGGAAVTLNLIRFGGAETPSGIWKEVVVPQVSLSSADSAISDSARRGANYTYDVLALQPFLNCTTIPQNAISNTNMTYQVSAGRMGQYASAIGTLITVRPPGIDRRCSNTSVNGFANLTFGMELRTTNPMWIGKYFDLLQSTAGQVSTDCPSIGMVFGSVTRNSTTDRNLTAVICSQGIKQVPTTAIYNENPALGKIDSIHTRDESKIVQNDTSKAHTLGYKLEGFLNANLLAFPANVSAESYDSFFNHLLLRPKGYSRDHLAGSKNEDKFVQAVTQDYNEYLRHVINRNLRAVNRSSGDALLSATDASSARSLSSDSSITGTYSAEVTHLIIDGTSKLILQILLATMTVLSVIGFALVKIRRTLPRDPCSIGSTMALLADSQLCDRAFGIIPEAAEHMSEGQLRGVFDGWVFSLGWWSSGSSVAPSLTSEDIQGLDTARKLASDAAITVRPSEKRFGVDVGKASGWT
ncbi:hypothetical protein FALBO_10375 [Fusarium albosuccineum]|uniref:Uncharacterized protein n=1 Tax=Fusarium albosuccineum TaxID=1237068 RepID=A0A8H4L735_9HYPO|nr:hypothetical protein FALBO_10375 [Fusarium albosuccineum]